LTGLPEIAVNTAIKSKITTIGSRTPAVAVLPRATIQRGGDEPSNVRSPAQRQITRGAIGEKHEDPLSAS